MRQLIAVALFCVGLFCIAQAQVPRTGAGLGAPGGGIPLTNLVRWGKPDTLGLTNGANVTTYPDSSGNSNTLTPSATNPTFTSAGMNGHNGITFNGSSNYFTSLALGALLTGTATPFTFACVAQSSSLSLVSNTDQGFFSLAENTGGNNNPTHDLYYRSASDNWWSDRRDTSGTETSAQGAFTPDTNPHVFVFVFDGTNSSLYVDGALSFTRNANVGSLTIEVYTIAAHNRNSTVTKFFNGTWGDDLLWSRALNSTEIANVTNFELSKYGFSATSYPSDPASILTTALTGWWRDDGYGTVTNNATPSTWFSRVNSNAAVNLDMSSQNTPPYKTNVQNSRPAVLLTASSSQGFRNVGSAVLPATGTQVAFSWFGVVIPSDLLATYTFVGYGSSTTNTPLAALNVDATPNWDSWRRNDANTFTTDNGGTPTAAAHAFVYSYNGTSGTLNIDGTTVTSGTALATGSMTVDTMGIGFNARDTGLGGDTNFLDGYVAEVGNVNRALTGTEMTNIQTYLKNRWGTP